MTRILANVVNPLLRAGLAEMERIRPHNPVHWLGMYLLERSRASPAAATDGAANDAAAADGEAAADGDGAADDAAVAAADDAADDAAVAAADGSSAADAAANGVEEKKVESDGAAPTV